MDVDRAENENLIRGWGIKNLRYGFSFMNFLDLVIGKPNEFTIKSAWFSRIVSDLRLAFGNRQENHRQKGRA